MANSAWSRSKTPEWNWRDLLLLGLGIVLLGGITAAVARRSDWAVLVGAKIAPPSPIATLNTSDFHALAFDPRDPDIVYFGHHKGVMKSTDGGRTWKPILREGDAMGLVALDNSVIMAGHKVFMRTNSAGALWNPIETNLPDEDIHGFAVSPADPKTYFAFIVGYGLWRSDDAGTNWTPVSTALPETVLSLAIVPTRPETIYAGTMDKGLLKSTDGGRSFSSVTTLSMEMALGLAQDPRDPRSLFAGTEGGLYRSDADGATWTRVGLAGKDIATLAISRSNPERFLVVDAQGRVYRSDDGGTTWGGIN